MRRTSPAGVCPSRPPLPRGAATGRRRAACQRSRPVHGQCAGVRADASVSPRTRAVLAMVTPSVVRSRVQRSGPGRVISGAWFSDATIRARAPDRRGDSCTATPPPCASGPPSCASRAPTSARWPTASSPSSRPSTGQGGPPPTCGPAIHDRAAQLRDCASPPRERRRVAGAPPRRGRPAQGLDRRHRAQGLLPGDRRAHPHRPARRRRRPRGVTREPTDADRLLAVRAARRRATRTG